MKKHFDVAIIGLGAMGSSAAYYLSKAGASVIGFDRFQPPHSFGSSHGETRLTRTAYYEDPAYVPLLRRSHKLWRDLESRASTSIFHQTGLFYFGRSGSAVLRGAKNSAEIHGIALERRNRSQVLEQLPYYTGDSSFEAVFEEQAGYLLIDEAITSFLKLASQFKFSGYYRDPVKSWRWENGVYRIDTERDSYEAKRLVLCAGSWNSGLFQFEVPLKVHRQTLFWFDGRGFNPSAPCFAFDLGDHFVYGFSPYRGRIKVADHLPGEIVQDLAKVDRVVTEAEGRFVKAAVESYLGGVESDIVDSAVCLYTMTPDSHFVIGKHPQQSGVVVAGGFSGHGFKFASVVGEILCELTQSGKPSHNIDLFSVERFLK